MTGSGWPTFRRLKGELRLATSSDCDSRRAAEEDFRAALEISRAQGSTLLALRASVGLAKLLAGTSRGAEALTVLGGPVQMKCLEPATCLTWQKRRR